MKLSIIEPVGSHGGMDYYCLGLANGLVNNNVDVLYFSSHITERVAFKHINCVNVFNNLWNKNKIQRLFYFFSGYTKAYRISKKTNRTIVHLHFFDLTTLNLIVLLLAKVYHLKTVITIHDVESFHKKSNKFIANFCISLMDSIIVHNNFSKNTLLKNNKITKPIQVVHHGNYLNFIKKLPQPIKKNTINLLFFGQIKDVKGLDILLEAMKKVIIKNPQIKLTIAGKPWKVDLNYFEKLIKENEIDENVSTHFRFISDQEMNKFFEEADVVVLPYKRIYQSGVLLLAMSYGRATITSDLEPFKELVTDQKTTKCFKSEDSENLSDVILSYTHDEINRITTNANKLIDEKFNWDRIAVDTSEIYRTLI